MELWFTYALLSALCAGLFTFGLKIIAEKRLNPNILTAVYMGTSAVLSLIFWISTSGSFLIEDSGLLKALVLAMINGVLLSSLYVVQIKALHYIDATLFYPLYKTLGPLIVVCISLVYLKESLLNIEYIAIALSLAVPLMLISYKKEKTRQGDLKKGLLYLLFTAVVAAIGTILIKIAIDTGLNIWLLLAIQHFSGLVTNFIIGWKTKNPIQLQKISKRYIKYGVISGFFLFGSSTFFSLGMKEGLASIVYTIQSIYIIIPIILSVFFYREHINTRKVIAILLSIVALILFQI